MKKFTTLLLICLFTASQVFSQVAGNFISATIAQGSQANSVFVQIRSNTTLTGAKFSSFEFAIGIPSSVSPLPTATIVETNFFISYTPVVSTETQGGVSYQVYGFLGDGAQSGGAAKTYTAGVTYTVAEVFFSGGPAIPQDIRLMQLPSGGAAAPFRVNFYVADRGFDVTNKPAQFFSNSGGTVSNDGAGFAGSSFVTLNIAALPISVTDFNVVRKDNNAFITWTVENQDANADRFVIERSFNGINFTAIGTTPINVNGGSRIEYSYTDLNITGTKNNGIIYYRLRSVDKDGSFVNSDIKNLRLTNKELAMSLYPNPARTFTNLTYELAEAAKVTILISDAAGKIVNTLQINGVKGINQKQINVANYPAGMYNFKIQAGTQLQTISVIKAN